MKFKVNKSKQVDTSKVLFARVDAETYHRLKDIADKNNVKISELYRQMIFHCLNELEGDK